MTWLEAIKLKYEERLRYLEQHLGSGNAKSFEEYRFIVGQLKGMADLMQEIEELYRRAEKQ